MRHAPRFGRARPPRVGALLGVILSCLAPSAAAVAGETGGAGNAQSEARVESTPQAESPTTDADACIDENVKADLFAKRKRRDVRDRLFQQTNRHELTIQGEPTYPICLTEHTFWAAPTRTT